MFLEHDITGLWIRIFVIYIHLVRKKFLITHCFFHSFFTNKKKDEQV